MKTKLLMTALLTGVLSTGSYAGFEQFNPVAGGMNVFSYPGDNYLWNSSWGLPDVQSITTDDRTFELLPNISQYRNALGGNDADRAYWTDSTDGGVTAGLDGNKIMEGLTLFEMTPMKADITSVSFSFTVDAFDLDPSRYTLTAFAKVLDSINNTYEELAIDSVLITETGSATLLIHTAGLGGQLLQAGFALKGRNANPADDWGSATVTATALSAVSSDFSPPTPEPTFAVGPAAAGDNAISMTATTAEDTYDVEYYFACSTPGGHDSGWQSSTSYTNTGLNPGSTYTYTVQARDTSINTNYTIISLPASATTDGEDLVAPTPNPMTFATAPLAVSPTAVFMVASTATDNSAGVEYYFTCTSANGTDSGWQSSPEYLDWNLPPDSSYTYAVTARDTSINTNTTAASGEFTAMTPELLHWMINPITTYTGSSVQQATRTELGLDSLEIVETDSTNQSIVFGATGAAFGTVAAGVDGRNAFRTSQTDYNTSSFNAYVTIAFTPGQNAVITMGPGVLAPLNIGYGIPDLNAQGVDGIMAELTSTQTKLIKSINGVAEDIVTTVETAEGTHRLKFAYDALAETATATVDLDYTGGDFVDDLVIGTYSTAGMWIDQPVRVNIAGGDGLLCTDLWIVPAEAETVTVEVVGPVAGGMGIAWNGTIGETYDLVYKTDLVNAPAWTIDTSPGCSDIFATKSGTISVTSTVSNVAAFYKVNTK